VVFVTWNIFKMVCWGGILTAGATIAPDPYLNSTSVLFDIATVLGDTKNNDIRYIDKLIFTIWLNIDYN